MTVHEDPDIFTEAVKKRPMVIDFFNTESCKGDVANETLKDYSSQPISNSWTVAVFMFIINLAVVNAQTVLKYSASQHKNQPRHEFVRNLFSTAFATHQET